MSEKTSQDLIDDLDEILEQERNALIHGQLEQLEGLLEKKDALISDLNAIDALEREQLESVHEKVTRNQVLLDNAMQGIRTVAARMQELRRVRKGLDVYDKAGRKNSYATRSSLKLEKRA